MFACTEKAKESYINARFEGPLCLVVGSEGEGIAWEHLAMCDKQIAIPMLGDLDSLNVSVATGILLFEIVRQKRLSE